ncbi:uncharacterized protein LOC6728143 [Drosophila simulans]|uniref:GD20458 n=1 Tax=Drosophila simulans TaxID=7240 RepID=B4R0I2_DROSI|nr:uncharacterized protein LOC6728143 [Drosophila simulans]EDX12997.1 GD20458 [Drosophila simulans]KMZ03668.1 uncharacterized protein Dsimw501_GD20458 [Drosophila simulans]
MGNSLITSGKPSQRREKRLFERLSCSYAQAPNRMELNLNPLLAIARSIAAPPTPPPTPEKLDSDKDKECSSKAAIELLPNEMWLEIMSYLSYNDLQQLRMVSWRCRDLVHRRRFMEKGKVIVTQHNLEAIHKHAKGGNCYLSFERIELRNLRQCRQLENFLRLVGHEVKHLQVRHAPVFRNLDGKLPNLKVLTIATTSSMDDQHLKEMDDLDMKQFSHLVGFECDGVSLDSVLKMRWLLQLRRTENKVQLRHLQFEFRRNNENALLEVLQDHADTLVCVDLFFSCSPGIDTGEWCHAFENMHNLRTLKLSGNCHLVLLEAVLRAVPESAPIRQLDLTGMLSLTNELLLYIAGKWQSTLKVLDLMFCVQLNANCIDALRQLSGRLEALTMAYCRELTGMGLLQGLAGDINYSLQELHLEETIFLDESSMCQLLERLPNLRRLSLDNCRQAVTDRTMATICQYQTRLRNLNIDYCMKITDQGLMGYGDTPYPISRLRGLKELNLRGCRNVTDSSLKVGLKLPELRALSLGYCNRLTSEGFEALTQNCPSLEALCVSSCMAVDDETVLNIVSNLKRLRILNLSNCVKLTLQSIHHILAHGHNLVELIACSIDGMDHEQAQRILEAQRPQMKQVLL